MQAASSTTLHQRTIDCAVDYSENDFILNMSRLERQETCSTRNSEGATVIKKRELPAINFHGLEAMDFRLLMRLPIEMSISTWLISRAVIPSRVTAAIGFNRYDNEEKLRLKTNYQVREKAESECQRFNLERLQSVLSERESVTAL
ncbi:unnamed protein product, partial [Mesorhabditis spiculigera]